MKNSIIRLLSMAFAVMAVISCEKELFPLSETSGIKVSVSAGFAETKSEVVSESGSRRLNFSSGDQLYVRAEITGTYPQKIVAGYLDISDISGASARFSGSLDVYEYDGTSSYSASQYAFASASNPLAECSNILGTLVHSGSSGIFTLDALKYGSYSTKVAPSVAALMTSCLPVYGYYDKGSFTLGVGDSLSRCTPIFNCSLSLLAGNTSYNVAYVGESVIDLGIVESNSSGEVIFACCVSGVTTAKEAHELRLAKVGDPSAVSLVRLGTKALASTVYNVALNVIRTAPAARAEDVGFYVGADGYIYEELDEVAKAGTTAEAKIAYVGAQDGVCEHGLAISLVNVYEYNATFAEAIGDAIIPSWIQYHPVPGCTWRLPSFKDWQYIVWGYYTDDPVSAPAGVVVKSVLEGPYFWTSTSVDVDEAKLLYYDGANNCSFSDTDKVFYGQVRACLAF